MLRIELSACDKEGYGAEKVPDTLNSPSNNGRKKNMMSIKSKIGYGIIKIACILICLMCVIGGILAIYYAIYYEGKSITGIWGRLGLLMIGIVSFLPPIFYWLSISNDNLLRELSDFKSFSQISPESIEFLFRKRYKSYSLKVFNLRDESCGNTDASLACGQTVAYIRFSEICFPFFSMQPRALRRETDDSETTSFSWDTDTTFFEKFTLEGFDESGIKELFTCTAQKFLQENDHLCIEGVGNKIIICDNSNLIPYDRLKSFFRLCNEIVEVLTGKCGLSK